jgi:hypothetical protein
MAILESGEPLGRDGWACHVAAQFSGGGGRAPGPRRSHMGDSIPTTPPGLCDFPEGSQVRLYHVANAAHDHLVRWVEEGTPPPTAPLIQMVGPFVARYALGLALGGIRIADLEVPTALNTGSNGGPSFCLLFGNHVPFDQATLDALYPDHGSYVEPVTDVVNDNLAGGYITNQDAQTTRVDAAHSEIGK